MHKQRSGDSPALATKINIEDVLEKQLEKLFSDAVLPELVGAMGQRLQPVPAGPAAPISVYQPTSRLPAFKPKWFTRPGWRIGSLASLAIAGAALLLLERERIIPPITPRTNARSVQAPLEVAPGALNPPFGTSSATVRPDLATHTPTPLHTGSQSTAMTFNSAASESIRAAAAAGQAVSALTVEASPTPVRVEKTAPTHTPEPSATATDIPSTSTPEPGPTAAAFPATPTPEPSATDTSLPPTPTPEPSPTATTIPPTFTPQPSPTATAVLPTPTFEPSPTLAPVSQAAPSTPSQLVIPAIDLQAPVITVGYMNYTVNGQLATTWSVPQYFAAGWHHTSAPPGQAGNTVLNGHQSIHGGVFRNLGALQLNDEIIIQAGGTTHRYRVAERHVLQEEGLSLAERAANARWIMPTADQRLTLVTCAPFAKTTHRLILVALPIN